MGKRFGALIALAAVVGVGVFWASAPGKPAASGEGDAFENGGSPETPERVRVEVLNGGGVSGAAWEATARLRDAGIDVVGYGNAETYSADSSVVLDRVGNPDAARRVGAALGIPRISTEVDSTLLVDVTVRLGPEWSPHTGQGAQPPERP